MIKKYKVILWETQEVIREFDNLSSAKRFCRKQGADKNLISGNMKYYAPLAFAGDEKTNLIYNPRFKIPAEDYPKIRENLYGNMEED